MSQSVPESKEGSKEGGDGADPGGREEESSQTKGDLGRGWEEARLALRLDLDEADCTGLERHTEAIRNNSANPRSRNFTVPEYPPKV